MVRQLATLVTAALLVGTPSLGESAEEALTLAEASLEREAFGEAREHLARCVELSDEESLPTRQRCHRLAGLAAQRLGAFPEAVASYRDALVVAEGRGDHSAVTAIWNGLGFLQQSRGDYAVAIDSYTRALLHDGADPTPIQLARCLNNIATLFNDLGHHGLALEYLDRSERAFRLTGKGETRYPILVNRGLAHHGLGEHALALDHFRRALVQQRAAGSERAEATSLSNIGGVHLDAGRPREALKWLDQALEIQQRMELASDAAATLASIASAQASLGENGASIELAEASLRISRELGLRRIEGISARLLADGYEVLGRVDDALALLREAEGIERELARPETNDLMAALQVDLRNVDAKRSFGSKPIAIGSAAIALLLVSYLLLRPRLRSRPHYAYPRPICARCKSLRDVEGAWHPIEEHLSRGRRLDLTHGLCPDCSHELNGDRGHP